MSGDSANSQTEATTVPVDLLPNPIVGYELTEERVIIVTANDAFERLFGAVSPGTPLRDWFDSAATGDTTVLDTICSSLVDGSAVDTELRLDSESSPGQSGEPTDAGRYRLRTVAREGTSDAVDGYLFLTELATNSLGVDTARIASVVSHDLRNPLDVANAHLRVARETGREKHFDEVRESHDRMERIIRDVLTLARGRQALDCAEEADLGAVASDAWSTVETGSAGLIIEEDLPTVSADPDRLRRLFENLFRNSVEHGLHDAESERDRAVQVRVGETDDGFFVSDDGPGIPAARREEVFSPGVSLNGTGEGSGLGLTIVEQIADAHDWTVTVTDGQAGGARFEFLQREEAG